jgi:hypothetical protein
MQNELVLFSFWVIGHAGKIGCKDRNGKGDCISFAIVLYGSHSILRAVARKIARVSIIRFVVKIYWQERQ